MNVLNGVTSPYIFLLLRFALFLTVMGSCFLTMPLDFNFIYRLSSSIHHVMSLLVYTPIVRSNYMTMILNDVSITRSSLLIS